MKRKILEFSIIWVALFCFSAVTYAAPIVNVETTAMELISESRSGRTTFDYTYKATFTNNGTDASDVTATVSSINTSVQVIEGAVVIGDLPGTIPTTSNDTFTIRVDRRIPFNADYLTWTFDAIEPISTDSLAWGEESIDAEVFNGTVVAKEVSFISTNTIENISFNIFDDCEDEGDCSARPKLVNLIEVVQLTPGPTVANEQVRLALVFSIPSDTPDGKYSGVLNVRDGERTIARPLQLDIIVTAGTATVAPDGFADPLSERIATDPIEKIRYIIDEILVVLKPDVSFDAFSSAIASMGGVIIGSDNELNTYQTRFPGVVSADALDAIIQDINLIDNVMSVSRNWEFSLLRAPDDKYNDKWDYNIPLGQNAPFEYIKLPSAWDLVYGNIDKTDIEKMEKIRIAIVDDAFDIRHVDLKNNINKSLSKAPLIKTLLSGAFGNWHGNSVAGIIGAEADNKTGVAGIVWNANLRLYDGISLLDGLFTSGVTKMIKQAIKDRAQIINGSFGVELTDETNREAHKKLMKDKIFDKCFKDKSGIDRCAKDVLFVFGVGNFDSSSRNFEDTLPASLSEDYTNIISVTAVEPQLFVNAPNPNNSSILTGLSLEDYIPDESIGLRAQGGKVNVAAPGLVYTTKGDSSIVFPRSDYHNIYGTSFATPTVSGLAGLLLTKNDKLLPAQLRDIIIGGACKGGKDIANSVVGESNIPIIDAFESLKLAGNPDAAIGACMTVSLEAIPSSIEIGESATLTWSSTETTSCFSDDFSIDGDSNGSVVVSPGVTTTYSIVCFGWGGSATDSVTVEVTTALPQPTASIMATPASIEIGEGATLDWSSTNSTSCTGAGFATLGNTSGSIFVAPTTDTTYTLTCTGSGGTDVASVTITVTSTPQPPTISINPQSVSVNENAGSVNFTIRRTDSTEALTLYVSTVQNQGFTNNGDYLGKLNEAVSFSIGQYEIPISIDVYTDAIVEGDETFAVIVQQSPTDSIDTFLASATFTILDVSNDNSTNDLVQALFAEGDPGTVGDDQFIFGTSYNIGFLRSATIFNPDPRPFLSGNSGTITLTVYADAPVFGLESYIFFGLRGDQCNFVQRTIDKRIATELNLPEPVDIPGIFGEINVTELLADFSTQGCVGSVSDLYVRQVQVSAFFGGEMRLDAFAIGDGELRVLKYTP